ncbi:MAG: hypothetical protein ABIP90_00590 [Vicinamibacterales bacterium]
MLLLMLRFDLNPYVTVFVGTCGTVTGRFIFSALIIPWLGERTLSRDKETDLRYLGTRLTGRGWAAFFFIFLYSLLPLSTTALFTAAGLARVRPIVVLPPFFLGNLIGDGFLLISGKATITSFGDLFKDSWSVKDISVMAFGLLVMLGLVFVDWRSLLQKKKLKWKWVFWR